MHIFRFSVNISIFGRDSVLSRNKRYCTTSTTINDYKISTNVKMIYHEVSRIV